MSGFFLFVPKIMQFTNYKDIAAFAESEGFFVTSKTGGKHNVGSKHARGLAIDVRTRDKTPQQCDNFIEKCRAAGLVVRDERTRPSGQKVWSGAHLHIEIATGKARTASAQISKKGSRGVAVSRLQRRLVEIGLLSPHDADGIFGAKTENAIKDFQTRSNLPPDGIVGIKTMTALFGKQEM